MELAFTRKLWDTLVATSLETETYWWGVAIRCLSGLDGQQSDNSGPQVTAKYVSEKINHTRKVLWLNIILRGPFETTTVSRMQKCAIFPPVSKCTAESNNPPLPSADIDNFVSLRIAGFLYFYTNSIAMTVQQYHKTTAEKIRQQL